MEVKCECPKSKVITITQNSEERQQQYQHPTIQHPRNDITSDNPLFWQHPICINDENLSRTIEYSSCKSDHKQNNPSNGESSKRTFKNSNMVSWRHPATACFAPCINTRRLNRSYSEQKMRCLLTTTIAFCLGISVGALLPFFFPPVENLTSSTSSSLSSTNTLKVIPAEPLVSLRVESLLTPQYHKLVAPSLVNSDRPFRSETQNISVHSPVTFVDNSFDNVHDTNKLEVDSSVKTTAVEATSGDGGAGVQLVNGIFWSDWVEKLLPRGFSEEDIANWKWQSWNGSVTNVEAGCGRMQNRLITYGNGKKACCRYRQNFDQIQGEIFSFYLSQLLGIKNLAPSALDVIDSKNPRWNSVRDELQSAQWVDDRPVVLTQFVNNLSPAYIPNLLRSSTRRVHPPDLPSPQLLFQLSQQQSGQQNLSDYIDKGVFEEVSDLAQWSDLIVFDYLTANLDRMVNNLYNLQWNPSMMEAPAHNLAKDTSTGLLVFLDNESGLLHGYRLLDKYEHYHRLMLDSLCVFRKSTAEAIRRLRSYGKLQPLFKSMLSQFKKSQLLPMIPDKSIKVLNQRIDTVYRQIQKCQSLYSSSRTRK